MTGVLKAIFQGIHEGKWLSIVYRNKRNEVTNYWIGIHQLDPHRRTMTVEGLHLGELSVRELTIYIDSIQEATVLEGTYCPRNEALIEDIRVTPERYGTLFTQIPNLKILNYLIECNRMDTTPYRSNYRLIHCFDGDTFENGVCSLTAKQFGEVVKSFQYQAAKGQKKAQFRELGLNAISIPVKEGLYVLAYQKLYLDVSERSMRVEEKLTYCREFFIGGAKLSISRFLGNEDLPLLDDPATSPEDLRDLITWKNPQIPGVDDRPYVIALDRKPSLDLEYEYAGILEMYEKDETTPPIRAFFGEYLKRSSRRKEASLALMNRKVNLDQLLAMHNAMKYPLAYIQGPPGTGKTTTILNTLTTAFFNERTVLFTSGNNHPIDEVYKKLRKLCYRGKPIPFPVIRLGNRQVVEDALDEMLSLYERTKAITVFETSLDKNRDDRIRRTAQLTKLLSDYDTLLELRERRDVAQQLLDKNTQLTFRFELTGRQLAVIDQKIAAVGTIQNEDALALLDDDEEELMKYLYFTSAKYLKRLGGSKYQELMKILRMERDNPERVNQFNTFLSKMDNMKAFLRVFPLVFTTCISAHRLGEPEPLFDMVIMDEASQCNNAVSLVPILRGKSLMLVGDPQQLQPVILLDSADNLRLRKKYTVPQEYDYCNNSIYKTFLSCDPISDEVLLRTHYRCHPKIISFNNRKYYSGRLLIQSNPEGESPLRFVDIKGEEATVRNTAPAEAEEILRIVRQNPGRSIGVITPFASQNRLIRERLDEAGFRNISCGTVHAFQGDEKDVVLFSLGLTNLTRQKTYDWLKNNRELINVATSRAKEELIVLGSGSDLERLGKRDEEDDLYDLVRYIRSNGESQVSERAAQSRALGVKPYSTETEAAFLESLTHAIDTLQSGGTHYVVHKEVQVSQVFQNNPSLSDLFYTGRFDFVVYERWPGKVEVPVLAIELDGREHFEDEAVKKRDRMKDKICQEHHFELIRVENSYARRYHYIKEILISYFKNAREL